MWANRNPYAIRSHAFQRRFVINISAGIVQDHLIGLYLLPTRLDGDSGIVFLQEVLPKLLNHVPFHIRRRMWFQNDEVPAHYSEDARNALNIMYPALNTSWWSNQLAGSFTRFVMSGLFLKGSYEEPDLQRWSGRFF